MRDPVRCERISILSTIFASQGLFTEFVISLMLQLVVSVLSETTVEVFGIN